MGVNTKEENLSPLLRHLLTKLLSDSADRTQQIKSNSWGGERGES